MLSDGKKPFQWLTINLRCFCQHRKTRAKRFPNFPFDLTRLARTIDEDDALWLLSCELVISFANAFVKLGGLLFHPISFTPRVLHSRLRSRGIDVEHESDVREAIAYRERVQALDHLAIQFACRSLIDCRGIQESVGDHACAAFERRPDYLAHELAAAGRKKQQFGLGRHRGIVRSKL